MGVTGMRFDDMIATVLERASTRVDQRIAQWRQLVDLVAQGRAGGDPAQVTQAYAFLQTHREEVPLPVRAATARALAGLPIDPRMVALFGEDHPSVGAPLLRGAMLPADGWIGILPGLTPTGRATLRHRRDLPEPVMRALETFGSSDFVIEGSIAEAEAPAPPAHAPGDAAGDTGSSQIRELVERIEAFQRHREEHEPVSPALAPTPVPASEEFRWETGPEGVVLWVDGAPRGPLVGQSIAVIAGRGQFGVDGQAAGAFHKRAPFRDARLTVAGEGSAAGSWRISGVPYFDLQRGSFRGYRGTARRPRLDEVAAPPPPLPPASTETAGDTALFGADLPADSLRQLVHELRTPLNAIIGFAEMIEGQYMGPAGGAYRGRAAEIVQQAQRLLGAVDDLDTAAQIETRRFETRPSTTDAAALLGTVHRAFAREAAQQGVTLTCRAAADLPPVTAEAAAAERMFSRLIAATIGLAAPGETIALALAQAGDGTDALAFTIGRPRSIEGLEEPHLLHPGYSPQGDWPAAPALGLGFALRLVRKLAEAAGGGLTIRDDTFVLTLAAARAAAGDTREDHESA